jgi:hypothetical protein
MIRRSVKRAVQRLHAAFGNVKKETFDFDLIENYYAKKNNSEAAQVISDRTCNDLDFHELFKFVDRTHSKVGQQYLYNKLRTIPLNPADNSKDEPIISLFSDDPDTRAAVQIKLERLKKKEAGYIPSLIQENHVEPPKWYFFYKLLSITSLLLVILFFFYSQVLLPLLGVFIINLIIHSLNKKNLRKYIGTIPQLLKLQNIAGELYKYEQLKTINPGLPQSIKILNRIRNRMFFFKLEGQLEADLMLFFWGLFEFFKVLFLLEPLLLFNVLKELDTKRAEIEDVYTYVGRIDTLISIASLREGLEEYCLPKIDNEQKISIIAKNVYHPLIEECVKNSINIDGKSILLTGSNMSGKTSFIRTIGINTLTALTLNTCFADEYSLPTIKILSAIRISDDLLNDKSYYFEEVLTIKEMIKESGSSMPNLFLLDEIYKGTNTVERISAGKAVLSSLAQAENIVLVSTHDIELADLLHDEFELYHFSELVSDKTVDFDYKLKDGKLKHRNAIRILQINDYPDSVVDEAIEISKKLDGETFL